MKKAEKTVKNAISPEQNLPGNGALSAGHAAVVNVSLQSPSVLAAPAAIAASADSRLVSLEKTHDLVAIHALRFSNSGNDTMRVVMEPGSGTRLSLELRFGSGGIEAHALLHRGDYEFLNVHWAELQQRLEPRGVHLGPLECSTGSGHDQQRSHQPSESSTDEQPLRSAFAEFALDPTMSSTRSVKGSPIHHDGWETWA